MKQFALLVLIATAGCIHNGATVSKTEDNDGRERMWPDIIVWHSDTRVMVPFIRNIEYVDDYSIMQSNDESQDGLRQ